MGTMRRSLASKWWQSLRRYRHVDAETFASDGWQRANTIASPTQMEQFLREEAGEGLAQDFRRSLRLQPMAVRVTPYILSCVDWSGCRPLLDPVRRQFVPLGSEALPDHPLARYDSLNEMGGGTRAGGGGEATPRSSGTVPNIVHRYPSKVLFLALSACPVYCRFCTRSYAVGDHTESVRKTRVAPHAPVAWRRAIGYISQRPEIRDVLVSGGDCSRLSPDEIKFLGSKLLAIPHVQRLRFATKALSVLPTKITDDHEWVDSLSYVSVEARNLGKHICVHTHINHASEVSELTVRAARRLQEIGVVVRNQSVMLRGVNDSVSAVLNLSEVLGDMCIDPYYMYLHDLIPGNEGLRTSLKRFLEIESQVTGLTSGFLIPRFVVDLPNGGGKRNASSYVHYDLKTGLSIYTSPSLAPEEFFIHCDPLDSLHDRGYELDSSATSFQSKVPMRETLLHRNTALEKVMLNAAEELRSRRRKLAL